MGTFSNIIFLIYTTFFLSANTTVRTIVNPTKANNGLFWQFTDTVNTAHWDTISFAIPVQYTSQASVQMNLWVSDSVIQDSTKFYIANKFVDGVLTYTLQQRVKNKQSETLGKYQFNFSPLAGYPYNQMRIIIKKETSTSVNPVVKFRPNILVQ